MAALLYFSQCIFYALDRWHAEGGGLVFVKSMHWFIPHVQHLSRRNVITHFVPPHDLKASWHALFGFFGTVVVGDEDDRGPMPIHGMLCGMVLGFIFWIIWLVTRTIQKTLRPTP